MGNCQAAEAAAAAVVIQDPRGGGNKVQRIYRVVSANEVMNSNPGHYVAMVIAAPPVKQLKLLRPADTLLLGHVYRLVSFEDVLKEFAARKCVKLGKLLKQIEASNVEINKHQHRNSSNNASPKVAYQSGISRGVGRQSCSVGGQWRPTLQTISEFGT
ncbi:hypothetical protein C2S53_002847 [Perilla frutescens var. hirtella]|uniref:Uncharacterized protein n=1 Tax=Perilla frutescens var. hirtella TaxID=608512 RepID=A0AAD4IZQ4_PERFH|nr:hypothetical protein C2S53_002847 [Perilla frutescens var. hirtella]